MMREITEKDMEVMQHNLKHIRKILGFSAANLADKLGCTRQLIQQLETNHHKMTQMFYMAMMWLISNEVVEDSIEMGTICKMLQYKVKFFCKFEC